MSSITSRGDAFSKMMSSIKENTAWREASKNEKSRFVRGKASNGTRNKAPFYKVLQGMPIAVDAFKYGAIPGITAYFLTHAHSDHYTNLSSSWKHGLIYCSEGTANLIMHMLSVDPKWVHPLPMDKPVEIPDTQGVTVTLIEANHCPGSCLFLFEGRQTVNAGDSTFKSSHVGSSRIFRYLHCGDFRASPRHVLHPTVKGKEIDHVYLDTTYLDPRYTFPPQPLVIDACAELARRVVRNQPTSDKSTTMISWLLPDTKGKEKERPPGKALVVVGSTYSIGKERIVKAIARSLNSKVYCDSRKAAILRCQVDSELDGLLTPNPKEALVHLVPLGTISTDQLKIYLERYKDTFDRVIGFRPTGWTYSQPAGTDQLPSIANIISRCSQKAYTYSDLQLAAKSTSALQVYAVPYSEHSSFYELTCFAMSFNWSKMIATVNVGSENSRNKMNRWIHKWEAERKKVISAEIVPYRHLDYW
ncbi:DNA repair metallo-beta-lactamase-domain-containing protein [Panaeolus papilionaceus]|nr:DNA repair metallo-beta-lactamase-domain-containing protein [Panaeolus papilionaceus]